jgi:WhiB family redox-sensing transcriptional regulator
MRTTVETKDVLPIPPLLSIEYDVDSDLLDKYARDPDLGLLPEVAIFCDTILYLNGRINELPSIVTKDELDSAYRAAIEYAKNLDEYDSQERLGLLQQVFDTAAIELVKPTITTDIMPTPSPDESTSLYDSSTNNSWLNKTACHKVDPAVFFPARGESEKPAKKICAGCQVIDICLEEALIHDRFGIRGGTSERQRRIIRRQRGISEPLDEEDQLFQTRGD